jgi:hypothetical protein
MNVDNGKLILKSSPEVWEKAFKKYDSVINAISNSSLKKGALASLDKWKNDKLAVDLVSRNPMYLKKEELSKLMQWKLVRGKVRPRLQAYIDAISDDEVEEFTRKAYSKLKSGDLSSAIDICSSIRGIGPAFSTAILSVPDQSIPYMSDEALNVVLGSRKYVKSEALELASTLRQIARSVGSEWTASKCEKAIFSACHESINDAQESSSSPKKKARLS